MDKARIMAQKSEDGYQVVSASLWDEDEYIDYPGVLEGMIGEVYITKAGLREAVKELVGNKVRVTITLID